MTSIQAFCIVAAGVTVLASIWIKSMPWQIPVGLVALALALDKFAAK